MDLEEHAGLQAALSQRVIDADHGSLDEVGGGALQGGIGGGPLAERPDVEVLVLQLRNVAPATEQRLDVTPGAGFRHRAVEPCPHARKARKVLLNERLRLVERDAELPGQGERPLPVDRAEVDGLGAGAHLGRHVSLWHTEDQRRGLAMDVAALLERLHEGGVPREMREEA